MKKKITFYCDSMDRGGTEKATLDLVNSLPSDKYEITIVQLTPGGRYQKELNNNIKVKEILPVRPEKTFKWYWRFRRIYHLLPARLNHFLFIGNKQDVEVACGYGYPNVIVSKSKKAKKILWVHMDVSMDRNKVADITREEGKKYFGNIDQFVCVSKECAEKFNEKFGFEEKTKVIYNIVPAEKIRKMSEEKVKIELDENYFNIVSVGRLTWQKGYDILIDEMEHVVNEKPLTRLYIIGQGEDFNNLKEQIVKKHLTNNVFLLGYMENPYPIMKDADLYVCSSRHESFGLTVVESMILGTPVLATSCTGPSEILNNKYGRLVSLQNCLRNEIIEMINDGNMLEEYSVKGKTRAELFSEELILEKWEKELERTNL